jgi:sugar phosphate permease
MTALGMAWLACIGPDSNYVTHVALPMALLGIGQGISLSPLTVAGMAGVPARDAGAAAGVVNSAHQLGGSIGLAVLVVVFASNGGHAVHQVDLAHRVAACLAVGSALLWTALLVVLLCIVRRPTTSPVVAGGYCRQCL